MAHATNTSLYKLNHTMLRVKDPKASVKFYEENFGMKVISKRDFEEAKFTLYFLAFDSPKAVSHGKNWTDRESVLELTHNWGTETNPAYKINNGNGEEHKDMLSSAYYSTKPYLTEVYAFRSCHWRATKYEGFSPVFRTIAVDSVKAAVKRLKHNGVKFHGEIVHHPPFTTAVCDDPDGYWVQLMGKSNSDDTTDPTTYHFKDTMLRVKDAEKSLQFYQSVLGLSLLHTVEMPEAQANLYFLGYRGNSGDVTPEQLLEREGGVGLIWNYGTEKDETFKYHNGNNEPQGFGHLCVSVDNLDEACARFEDLQVNWKKRLTDGRMKSVAFILDPDEYWIEVIQNEGIKRREGW